MATDTPKSWSAWRTGWKATKQAHHGITFSWGVDVMMMAFGGIIGELAVPSAPTDLERALYPGIGGVLGFVLGVLLLFLCFTLFAYARQNFTLMATNIAIRVAKALTENTTDAVTETSQPLSQDQIAERQLFIFHLRSAALRLEKNTHYNILGSAASRFNQLNGNPQVHEVMQKDEAITWVYRLLNGEFTALAMECWDSERRSDELTPSRLSNDDITSELNKIAGSIRRYRQLIFEFQAFIQTLEQRGTSLFEEESSWSDVFEKLADDYDELMQLIKDLRNATPMHFRTTLPHDDQLTKYPRTES